VSVLEVLVLGVIAFEILKYKNFIMFMNAKCKQFTSSDGWR